MNLHERSIMAAQGYLELGMFRESLHELDAVPARLRRRPDVLEILALSLMGGRRWAEALDAARDLRKTLPDEPGGYIHEAYCLHELGRTREALETLLKGPESLHGKSVYYYNAACYRACLGEMDDAVRLLETAFEMDASLRHAAKQDPDLVSLKNQF